MSKLTIRMRPETTQQPTDIPRLEKRETPREFV